MSHRRKASRCRFIGSWIMLLKLNDHIKNCLERAAVVGQRARDAVNEAVRSENEVLAQSWLRLANSYRFVESQRDTARRGGTAEGSARAARKLSSAPSSSRPPTAPRVISSYRRPASGGCRSMATLIAADSRTASPTTRQRPSLIRQILGAASEFDKAMTVVKLRGARDRKRRSVPRWKGSQEPR